MLPAKLGAPQQPGKDGKTLGGRREATRILSPRFGTTRTTAASARARDRLVPLKLPTAKDPATDAHVIVKYTDGTPAAVEGPYGKGRVVLFSSTATTAWNNLPIHPNFVPLLQRLIGYLSPDKGGESAHARARLGLPGRSARRSRHARDLRDRPRSNGKPRPAGKVELVNQDAVVRYRDTAKTGQYRFTVPGVETPISAFAVQMDAKESDLRMISADKLAVLDNPENPPRRKPMSPPWPRRPQKSAGNSGPSSSGSRSSSRSLK